ncbi:hypothetical protein HPB48_020731 [Haemaphysalis longicornis]|uniref:Uncharacterized protein n=1 Tax=Haemaphysalis longicornis TaxID=44386 RepID=A0A9J6G7N0_HAELO|nr:hypothetical protein HPB48_020731 [Haemaphysalis longicornis]
MGDGKLQCLGSLAHLKDKFGQGHTITVQTYPDRKQDVFYLREVASAVTYLFKEAELVHTYQVSTPPGGEGTHGAGCWPPKAACGSFLSYA